MTVPAELEDRLGDAFAEDNPLGHRAVVAADERGELLAEGERMLDDYRLGAEFVPRALGGRLDRADRLAHTVRAVFRRDATLGIGYGVTSLIAAVPVWTSGSAEQRAWLAELLLTGGRASAGYTELAHGADFGATELRARPGAGGFVLGGGKQLVNNVARARALTLFARTDDRPGSRSHSHLLVDLAALPGDRVRYLPRFPTTGMRATPLAGIEFDGCPVPAGSLLGPEGGGMETVLKAFQLTRCVLPGVVIGILDTQLRLATRFATGRTLYGGPVADLPLARAVLAGALLDLLVCDSLATVAARALHVLPGSTSVYAAAVKYLVPKLLQQADYRLGTLVGARSYLREGPYAVFQKNTRDLPVATLAHASPAVCQATIIPQLPRLARHGWVTPEEVPASLFRLRDELPALDLTGLGLHTGGADPLAGTLAPGAEPAEGLGGEPALAALRDRFAAELAGLRRSCAGLAPRDRTVVAGPGSFALADRYATVLAAAACLGVWQHNQDDGFLGDPAWVTGALSRLACRLDGGQEPGTGDDALDEWAYAALLARYDDTRCFDLGAHGLAAG